MADSNNSMIITSTALTHMSKELIDKREFDNTSVVTVGNPSILNGIARSFSDISYFTKEDLDFTKSGKLNVTFKSTFLESDENQVLFVLGNQDVSLKAYMTSASVNVAIGTIETLRIPVTLSNDDKVTFKFQLTATSADLLVFVGSEVYQASIQGTFTEVLQQNYTLYIGSDPLDSKLYWQGSIDLKEIIISLDGTEYYSTAVLKGYTFTKLLVSDGTIELTDDSTEVLNHIVECPLSEITRTGNNILLKATLASDEYLVISEVGLYCSDGDSSILFSKISDLTINKSSDLDYSLILHVNLDVNVVNTTVLPEIIIEDEDSVNASDFEKVKRDHSYMTSNLERMIKENSLGLGNYKCSLDMTNSETSNTETRVNALGLETAPLRTMTDSKPSGIGYNKAQVDYRTQKDLNAIRDSYNAVLDYCKVQERYSPTSELVFSDEGLTKVGSVVVNEAGEASVFSEVDYVKAESSIKDMDSFDITMSFKVSSTLSETGTICCFDNDSIVQPFTLNLVQDMVHLTIGQEERIAVTANSEITSYVRGTTSTVQGSISYYRWNYSGSKDVPSSLYTTKVNPTSSDKLYKLDTSGSTSKMVEYSGTISALSSGAIIDEDIIKAKIGTKQSVKVTFDGNKYQVYVKEADEDYILFSEKVTPLKMGSSKEVLFGIGYSNSTYDNHFYGTIYLAEFGFIGSSSSISFLKEKILQSILLEDYYHIPLNTKLYYDIPNLNYYSSDYSLNVQGSALEGKKDNIELDSSGGFSLVIKAKLASTENKVALAKADPEAGLSYFVFEVEDNKILFTIYTEDSTIVLSKELSGKNFRRYLSNAALFTLICKQTSSDRVTCDFYMNKELLDSISVPAFSFGTGNYRLTNYLEEKSEAEENYVSDILSFEGSLTKSDLYYLCNILDTNF